MVLHFSALHYRLLSSNTGLDLQGYRRSQQGGGSQARSFKDQITGLFRPGPTSENQQPSSDSSKPQSNFFLELPVKDHRSVMNSTKVQNPRHKMQVALLAEPKTPLESSVFI